MMHVGDILSRVGNIIHTSEHHCACGGRGGGGDSLIKVGTDVQARAYQVF